MSRILFPRPGIPFGDRDTGLFMVKWERMKKGKKPLMNDYRYGCPMTDIRGEGKKAYDKGKEGNARFMKRGLNPELSCRHINL
jgi:hypothetical protein